MGERVILHVDMDAFFASVEVLDDPSLRGRPVIVGGSGRRGVVAACTYEARRFGVRSAMPSAVARRLCPSAIFVHGRYHRYQEESEKLHAILRSVTPLVEGISIDEAFLDVTGAQHRLGDGRAIAAALRARVHDELHLTCSVGVARSKLVAKLASEAAKPVANRVGIEPGRGVVVVPGVGELAFLHALPVRALWGVGPATGQKLAALGVDTVGDLAVLPDGILERTLGPAAGTHLAALSKGHDPRPVVPDHVAKSIGHEETFTTDLWDRDELHGRLVRLVDASVAHLRGAGLGARTVTVKIRFDDFATVTRSHSTPAPADTAAAIGDTASALFDAVERDRGVRLLGVSLSGLGEPAVATQLALDLEGAAGRRAEAGSSWGPVSAAVDEVRSRFGGSSVGPASLVGPDGLRVRRRGDAQWGPSSRGSDAAAEVPGSPPGRPGAPDERDREGL